MNAVIGKIVQKEQPRPGGGGGVGRRRYPRVTVVWAAEIVWADGSSDCVVLNISINGAKIQVPSPYTGPAEITLKLERFGDFPAVVAWSDDISIGIQFRDSPEKVAAIIGEAVPGVLGLV